MDHRRMLPDDPRFGKWGRQKCEDTGPLTTKRMTNIDYEITDASMDFMTRAARHRAAGVDRYVTSTEFARGQQRGDPHRIAVEQHGNGARAACDHVADRVRDPV